MLFSFARFVPGDTGRFFLSLPSWISVVFLCSVIVRSGPVTFHDSFPLRSPNRKHEITVQASPCRNHCPMSLKIRSQQHYADFCFGFQMGRLVSTVKFFSYLCVYARVCLCVCPGDESHRSSFRFSVSSLFH